MTDPERASIPPAVHDAAGAWLVRRQAGAGAAVEQAFAAWLEADPRHRIAYAQVARDWRDSAQLADSAIGRTRKLVRAPFLMRRSTHVGAVSLSLAALLGLGTVGIVRHAGSFGFVAPAEAATYQTAVGEIRSVRLADGSNLTLDTSTVVHVRFSRASRRLDLKQGRARFSVAKDDRPFTVAVPGGEIVARHTLFDVSVVGPQPLVSLIEGEVALLSSSPDGKGSPQRLVGGEQAALGQAAAPRPLSIADARWVSGMLALEKTPLGNAVAAINRYNRTQVRLADPQLASLAVTGAFQARDPQQFARVVATMFGLTVDKAHPDILLLQSGRARTSTLP
ncbi:FecR family protein [Sphingobium yanoikuyae]|uniref:FecR family protein n=1 Tax=Sphingobium yanoikuyae TaxID=13690 RepID=UPI00241E7C9C|nr:FecR domain-containing protein [Sphingobium yanoikuyae]